MNNFGDITAGHARRAHLALVNGGGATPDAGAAREALGADPVVRLATTTPAHASTSYAARGGAEGTRSRHEQGVRVIARNYDSFEDALVPMVLASGVSGEAASAVAAAIRNNPALRAQAERAFQRARMDVVGN